MTKKGIFILVLAAAICLPAILFAETITLKSGQKREGKILEKTDKYVQIDLHGVPIKYNLEDIASIDKSSVMPANIPEDAAPSVIYINKLPFSTAIITYRYKGGEIKGEAVAYIDAEHNRINVVSNIRMNIMGSTASKNERYMYDGKAFYAFDFKRNTAIMEERKGSAISAVFHENAQLDYYSGNENFLNRECRAYKTPMGSTLYWNGIALREEVNDNPLGEQFNFIKEATDIKLDAPISEDNFKVPSGMKIMTAKEAIKAIQTIFKDIANKAQSCGKR